MKKFLSTVIVFVMLLTFVPHIRAAFPIVAFPGAEGAGKYATGGRGGTVYHVTNLNDSGAGSFRDAVSASNRIIVFDVGGTVELKGDVVVKGNNTIAGQTAPGGGGITLKGGKIGMGGDNIIIRFVSSRPGENGKSECDAWGGDKGSNSIIDHCSIGWANDEQFGLYSNNVNQTVQYSIIGPSNCISYHAKGAHGFGIMFGKGNNSWHHNMIAHNISRNFRGKVPGSNSMDYVNNVIFNWGYQTAYGTFGRVNYVGNYFKQGLSTSGGNRYISISSGTAPENYRFYLVGNKIVTPTGADYNTSLNTDNWNGVNYGSSGLTRANYEITSPTPVYDVYGNDASVAYNAQTADEAFETVLQYSGAGISAEKRPKIDRQVMEEARTGNGYLTGGRDFDTLTSSDTALLEAIEKYKIKEMNYDEYYPLPVLRKEITDTDNDGMPDEWELARGLNPSANDAMGDYLGQGYNNIEYYINDLTVDAFPKGVVTLSTETVELGEDYENAKKDAEAIKLSTTVVKEKGDLSLPSKGENGSNITWSSSSPAIKITNGVITAVRRPEITSASVTLTASVSCGTFTMNKYFTVTVPAQPMKFDFGGGSVQPGFVGVGADVIYDEARGYGFTGANQSNMTRAPGEVPAGFESLCEDQITGITSFKVQLPEGMYTVVIHYGSWNTSFGTSYVIEGENSPNLDSTVAKTYTKDVEVTDGVLELQIKNGNKAYGGYINGLEILKPEYHFDFGGGIVQEGYTGVDASVTYSEDMRYGFENAASQYNMERKPNGVSLGYENLHADQVQGTMNFKAKIPNGEYNVTIHYGCWNTSFGTSYIVEGMPSGNLESTVAAEYTTRVKVTDGVLDIGIAKGSKTYGGYINGMDVEPVEGLPKAKISLNGEKVTVKADNISDAYLVYAVYTDGVLTKAEIFPLRFLNGEANVNVSGIEKGSKLMVWESVERLKAVSDVYIVP